MFHMIMIVFVFVNPICQVFKTFEGSHIFVRTRTYVKRMTRSQLATITISCICHNQIFLS